MITIRVDQYHAHSVIKMWREEGYEPFRIEKWLHDSRVKIQLRKIPPYLSESFVSQNGRLTTINT